MLSSVFTAVIILFGLNWTLAVNMCTNSSTVATYVTLNLIKGTDVDGCYCTVKLHNTYTPESVKSRIIFEVIKFSGCKYSLVISYHNISPTFSCSNNSTIFYNINKTDEIKLYLYTDTSSQDDTEFEVKITSNMTTIGGPRIGLECFATYDNTSITTCTQTVIQQTTSTERTTTTILPYTASSGEIISTSVPLSSTSSTEGMINSSTKQDDDDDSGNDDVVTAGIIGGVIGVVIGGVVGSVGVILIKYIVKNRKKKSTSEIYSSTSSQNQPESQYTDLQLS